MKPLRFMATLMVVLALTQSLWAAEGPWEPLVAPPNEGGLYLNPRMTAIRGRLHLFWVGTSAKVRSTELFHTTMTDGSDAWSEVKAPFFGIAKNRVRQIGVAAARDMIGVIFQRQLSQSDRAMEVLTTFSSDNGWSFSPPYVVDSFVGPDAAGTHVAIGAREGRKGPEFALGWAVDSQALRCAPLDFRSKIRPSSVTVGHYEEGENKIDVVGAGEDGLMAAFNEGSALRTARVKPLTGGVEPARTVAKGYFGRGFTAANHQKGPANLASLERGRLISYTYEGGIWKEQDNGMLPSGPLSAADVELRSAVDDDRDLHIAIHAGNKIYFVTGKGEGWSEPEVVIELEPNFQFSGFDVGVTSDYVYVVACQKNQMQARRRKLESLR